MPRMNSRISLLALGLSLSLCFAPAPASALSLFGGGKSARLEKAESLYQQGVLAESESRALDAVDLLQSAMTEFSKLHSDEPEYETERVKDGFVASHDLLASIMERLRTGELSVPDPDQVVSGGGKGYVSTSAESPVDLDAPKRPDSAKVVESRIPSKPVSAPSAPVEKPALAGAIPNPLFAEEQKPTPVPEEKKPAVKSVAVHEIGTSGKLPEDERLRALVLVNMIRKAQAPDVVMMLEDDFENPDAAIPLTTRLVFARALLECRNYVRAAEVLKAVPASDEGNPSVRTLRAALAVAQGHYEDAFYELDRLIADHPSYSDAYVDFAYVNFLMDPVGNRESSILYYKSGLEYGAKRDPRLEAELRVKIGK